MKTKRETETRTNHTLGDVKDLDISYDTEDSISPLQADYPLLSGRECQEYPSSILRIIQISRAEIEEKQTYVSRFLDGEIMMQRENPVKYVGRGGIHGDGHIMFRVLDLISNKEKTLPEWCISELVPIYKTGRDYDSPI